MMILLVFLGWFGLPTSTAFEARPPQEAFDRHRIAERLFNMSEAELQTWVAPNENLELLFAGTGS